MNENQSYNQQGNSEQFLEPHRGTMVLMFGILGILCCGIFAVLAWVFGQTDINKMRRGVMDASGMETTNIGKILGIVGVCLWVAGTFFYSIFFGLAAFFG